MLTSDDPGSSVSKPSNTGDIKATKKQPDCKLWQSLILVSRAYCQDALRKQHSSAECQMPCLQLIFNGGDTQEIQIPLHFQGCM